MAFGVGNTPSGVLRDGDARPFDGLARDHVGYIAADSDLATLRRHKKRRQYDENG